jgi:hypothetical protein
VEFILEIILTAIWEIALQMSGELLLELGFQTVGESFRRRSRAHPVLAGTGVAIMGATAGLITSWLLPSRILQPSPIRGVSLVVSPVVTGALMEGYGRWRQRRDGDRSFVATFWGGALFALSMSLVRLLLVGRAR